MRLGREVTLVLHAEAAPAVVAGVPHERREVHEPVWRHARCANVGRIDGHETRTRRARPHGKELGLAAHRHGDVRQRARVTALEERDQGLDGFVDALLVVHDGVEEREQGPLGRDLVETADEREVLVLVPREADANVRIVPSHELCEQRREHERVLRVDAERQEALRRKQHVPFAEAAKIGVEERPVGAVGDVRAQRGRARPGARGKAHARQPETTMKRGRPPRELGGRRAQDLGQEAWRVVVRVDEPAEPVVAFVGQHALPEIEVQIDLTESVAPRGSRARRRPLSQGEGEASRHLQVEQAHGAPLVADAEGHRAVGGGVCRP